ncbi:AAA family ATPase [bacterium 3DAC]|jgi:Holliday junction DNA helicase RuvB|nr:AAA family ATPase [bacterium 3DAC]
MKQIVIPRKISRLIDEVLKGSLDRGEILPHMLLVGPPGVGKTTLASYMAENMGTSLVRIIGGAVSKPKDIVSILLKLSPGSILFIDEIHRLPSAVEEILYPAIDRFEIDVLIGKGKVKHISLSPFTLIGATTMEDKISPPLRSRFSIVIHVGDYEKDDFYKMIDLYADSFLFTPDAKDYVIKISRHTPRRLILILERLKDFATTRNIDLIDKEHVEMLLEIIDYDTEFGLDRRERRYLSVLAHMFNGGPAGVKAIAAAMGESVSTIQEIIEPSLLADGFILLTSRGRKLTAKGWRFVS